MIVTYDPTRHHRRSIRLHGYDYTSAGAYFITIVVKDRACAFGEIVDGEMRLSAMGQVAHEEWVRTAELRPYVDLDAFVVMPNHVHGILWIVGARRAVPLPRSGDAPTRTADPPTHEQFGQPVAGSIPTIVRAYKAAVTKRINEMHQVAGEQFWQRNYYEHIIRDEDDLERIRGYIVSNPLRWSDDQLQPGFPSKW